jgi:hypothetical protein
VGLRCYSPPKRKKLLAPLQFPLLTCGDKVNQQFRQYFERKFWIVGGKTMRNSNLVFSLGHPIVYDNFFKSCINKNIFACMQTYIYL